jgi:hypothetical protein
MLICTTFDLDQRLSLHCTYSLIQHWIYLTGQRWNRKARSQPTGRNGLGASSPQGGFDSGCKPSRYGSSRARSVHCGFALPVGHARSKFGRIKACGTSVGQRGAKSVTRASQSGQGGRISRARWCGRKAADSLENRDATAWLRRAFVKREAKL